MPLEASGWKEGGESGVEGVGKVKREGELKAEDVKETVTVCDVFLRCFV